VLLLSAVCLVSIFLINGTLGTGIAQSEEREFVDTTPKHLPIKVKIKKEKEQAFKDLKNANWYRDLEIEVTNIGDKPIYLLHFTLVLPEIVIDEAGSNAGFVLHYGRAELGDIKTKAEPSDVPIKPGETYVFNISRGQVLGWESYMKKHNKPLPKKVVLEFGTISFGDGTGFWATDGTPYPNPPKEKSNLSPSKNGLNKDDPKTVELQHASLSKCSKTISTEILPASFLPVNFLSHELSETTPLDPILLPQDCCPGNGCARVTTRTESSCLGCAPVTRYDVVSCSSSLGACKAPNFRSITCVVEETGFEYLCNDVTFGVCGAIPSQTPVPTDTSCPQVFPYQCPSGVPLDTCANGTFYGGCPSGYHPSADGKCCEPNVCPSPTPEPSPL